METGVGIDRVFACERCAQHVRICHRCDRGQRYCRDGCAAEARRESLHRAGQRYQRSPRGRRCHARRQSVYRQRQSEKVTHQGFWRPADYGTVELSNATQEVDDETPPGVEIAPNTTCHFAIGAARRARRFGGAERCAWCGRAGQRLVRFGYWGR